MEAQTATLIAASIAAAASLSALYFNLRGSRLSELRVAHRKTLEPSINELGEALHETVATSHILLKARSDVSAISWRNRSQVAKGKLLALVPKLRYPLWGITDALRTLSRLPDWVEHSRLKYPQHALIICTKGTKLSRALDRTIKNCYAMGRAPALRERIEVLYLVRSFRRSYKRFQDEKIPSKA